MKALLFLLFILLFTSCFTTDVVYGDPDIDTVMYEFENYSGSINYNIPCAVTITEGPAQVAITTNKNLQQYYSVTESDGVISLTWDSSYSLISDTVGVTISLPSLTSVVQNSGTVYSEVPLGDSVSILLSGNAMFRGNVHSDWASLTVKDSAALSLSGSVRDSHILIHSSRHSSLQELELFRTMIDINRVDSLSLNCSDRIAGVINDNTTLYLSPNPLFIYVDTLNNSHVITDIIEESGARIE